MSKDRLEAFSDGVIAIIITIMVLELKRARRSDLGCAAAAVSVFLELLAQLCVTSGSIGTTIIICCRCQRQVEWPVLWANMHLLFWLSLIPFVTRLDGRKRFGAGPWLCMASSCCCRR